MIKSSELAEYIKKHAEYNSNGTYEIRNICFEVDVPYIISYLDEGIGLDWYEKVYEPVSEPQINGIVTKLKNNRLSRQAQITMSDHVEVYNPTHICTTSMTYYIENNKVNVSVCMRSNDAKRFPNDVAWQQHTLNKICKKLNMQPGKIFWFAVSFHVYEDEWFYFEKLPHDEEFIFDFKVCVTCELNKDDKVDFSYFEDGYVNSISYENEDDRLYVKYETLESIEIDGRMEAYFNEDENDIHLEEDYEYSVDDIINKSEKLSYIINSLKSNNTKIVDIEAIEIAHNVKKSKVQEKPEL